jgi:hypothetical protein
MVRLFFLSSRPVRLISWKQTYSMEAWLVPRQDRLGGDGIKYTISSRNTGRPVIG